LFDQITKRLESLTNCLIVCTPDCRTSSCNPLRLRLLMPLKPTPLQCWMKEHRDTVEWRSIRSIVVVVELLPSSVEIVVDMLLKSEKVEPLVDLALCKIVDLSRYRRRNISLRCRGGDHGSRGGFTNRWSLASTTVRWSCRPLCWWW
jgi:hypothetical protein